MLRLKRNITVTSPPSKAHGLLQKRGWTECKGQRVRMTARKQYLLDVPGQLNRWNYGNCDHMHNPCGSSHHTKFQLGERKLILFPWQLELWATDSCWERESQFSLSLWPQIQVENLNLMAKAKRGHQSRVGRERGWIWEEWGGEIWSNTLYKTLKQLVR